VVDEIQHADPRARRLAILLVVGATLLGSISIALAQTYRPALLEWITRDPGRMDLRLTLISGVLALGVVGPLAAFAVYLLSIGNRIVRTERFPPPGVAMTRDTIVVSGAHARRRGRMMQLLAVILVLLASGFAIALWRLVSLLGARTAH
jgi:hypothetical protein